MTAETAEPAHRNTRRQPWSSGSCSYA